VATTLIVSYKQKGLGSYSHVRRDYGNVKIQQRGYCNHLLDAVAYGYVISAPDGAVRIDGGMIVCRVTLKEMSVSAFRLTVCFHWPFIGSKCAAGVT
jgi:hypothetical protein